MINVIISSSIVHSMESLQSLLNDFMQSFIVCQVCSNIEKNVVVKKLSTIPSVQGRWYSYTDGQQDQTG